jgi:hypothetical protein
MACDTSRSSALRTLVLALSYPNRASYYDDWRDAFQSSPSFDCRVENILTIKPHFLAGLVDAFDVIIMLHSCNSDTLDYFAPIAPVLGERKRGKLLSFVGNEFNSPYISLLEKVALFAQARCDLVATQLLAEAGELLYGGHGYRVISVPHALDPAAFKPGPGHDSRALDIGVKGYRYPPYLGDDDRNRMIELFIGSSPRWGLKVDISEDRRLNRSQWADFLANCRGTISTESGSWYLERDDKRIARIRAYLEERRSGFVISSSSLVRKLARRLPSPVKAALWPLLKKGPVKLDVLDDFNIPFAELYELFFRDAERARAYGKAISSRHFDAIGTKTCLIMQEGRYNDILIPNVHYIAIDPDHGNADQAIERFKDPMERGQIVDAVFEHVMSAHTYRHRAEQVRAALDGV